MQNEINRELKAQGRAAIGALVVAGASLLLTMETWWLGWQRPFAALLGYTIGGLALVLLLTRYVGFREQQQGSGKLPQRPSVPVVSAIAQFAELLLVSFVTAYVVLLMFGLIEFGDPASYIARMGLIEVVPLAFGAALANELLVAAEAENGPGFPEMLGQSALGAIFLMAPIAPTEELELLAVHAGWARLAIVMVVSVLVTYVALYEVEFQGQEHRIGARSKRFQVAEAVTVYAVALGIAFLLVAAFGHTADTPPPVWVQETVILGFPGAIGGSAARVVL